MSKELCEEAYQELIEFLKKDFMKKGKFLQSTTKLLLSLFCLQFNKDWKKDLKWEDKKESLLKNQPLNIDKIPEDYITPHQFVTYTRLFSESFITERLKNDIDTVRFTVKRKGRWHFEPFEFLQYVKDKAKDSATRRQAVLFLQNQECVDVVKDFLKFKNSIQK